MLRESPCTYIFALRALLEMSFVDGKFEPTVLLLANMNLLNASIFWDRYHLLNDIFPKMFRWV